MQSSPVAVAANLREDDSAMTAVIEFLTAFVLFLMIVTAFLSLAQLTLGPYDPTTDRLDEAAVSGLSMLTDSTGWFTPIVDETRQLNNTTTDWHLVPSAILAQGDVLPGLLSSSGGIDPVRLAALSNVTEYQLTNGIGLDDNVNLRLMIKVIESDDQNRVGMMLFDDGTPRSEARDSATASRSFSLNDEKVRVTLEVHDGYRGFTKIEISEFMPRPADGGPEWVELYNPNGFAVEMEGWGVERTTPGYSTASVLFENGIIPGGAHVLLSGHPPSQETGNASWTYDGSIVGLLGVGAIEGLGDNIGRLQLTHANRNSAVEKMVMEVEWGTTWNLSTGSSLLWNGGEPLNIDSWDIESSPTPGD